MTDRDRFVIHTASLLVERHVLRVPVKVEAIARIYGARFTPLTDCEKHGLGREALFAIWGNRDGAAIVTPRHWTICYNDLQPPNRVRFTIAEEMFHYLLGHSADERFRADSQSYDDATYELYEAEAKRAAGLLLVPPTVYYRYRRVCGSGEIARLCRVSAACVRRAAAYYDENEAALRELFTAKEIHCDTAGLRFLRPMRAISVWPEDGML